eukprot:7290032-Lingulodinium_polyedra.AAC.1
MARKAPPPGLPAGLDTAWIAPAGSNPPGTAAAVQGLAPRPRQAPPQPTAEVHAQVQPWDPWDPA